MITIFKRLTQWVDDRFPASELAQAHLSGYFAPKNFNFWYYFGSFAFIVLINQILTGIWLAMYYVPSAEAAFDSVETIMRDIPYGWLIRYMHSTGASFFFIVIYLHMFKAFLYGSYKTPRELLWILGVMLFMVLVAEAFMGYLLPWGQMSYWGAQVIISLFSTVPKLGESLTAWIRGDYNVSGVTLNRFYALHVIALPLVILLLVWAHIMALHHVGSNNPDGIDIKKTKTDAGVPLDGIPFHPYYTYKDVFGIAVFLILFAWVVFYAPEFGGYFLEHANFVKADPLNTPEHIAPVWYMTPYYAILRAIPNKAFGVTAMMGSILILFLLPWLDRCKVRSIRYRSSLTKFALAIFVISFLGLGYLGTLPVTPGRLIFARMFTAWYFLFFLMMPIYTRFERTLPVPDRVTFKH